jgi:hypothetical protein
MLREHFKHLRERNATHEGLHGQLYVFAFRDSHNVLSYF